MSLLPKGEKLLKIVTDTYFAASKGFKTFQKYLLELEKKGLIKSLDALQKSDGAMLESIYDQGAALHKSDPEKLTVILDFSIVLFP